MLVKLLITAILAIALQQAKAVTPGCGVETTYPTDDLPITDYDLNCNYNVRIQDTFYWFPRSLDTTMLDRLNKSAPLSPELARVALNVTYSNKVQVISRGFDTSRGIYYFTDGKPPKLEFPIDIRPSVRPIVTIELFLKWSIDPTKTQALFSTDLSDTNMTTGGLSHARSILLSQPSSDNPGLCDTFVQPWGVDYWTNCLLPSSSPGTFVHVVAMFDEPNHNTTIYINGVFSQTFNLSTVDGSSKITVGGKTGSSLIDTNSCSTVYIRAWDRLLNRTEIFALNDYWNNEYNRPITNTPYQLAYFNPTGPLYAMSLSAQLPNPLIQAWRHDGVNNLTLANTATSTTVLMSLPGNFTYTLVFRNCRYYNPQWIVYWNLTDNMCDLAVNYTFQIWTYVTPLSSKLVSDRSLYLASPLKAARVSFMVQFNRPVLQAVNMTVNQTMFRGQGSQMVDMLPIEQTYFRYGRPINPQDSWTMLSSDRRTFRWSFNMPLPPGATGSEGSTAAMLLLAPMWPITDDNQVPNFDRNAVALSNNFHVVQGLNGQIMPDGRSTTVMPDRSWQVGFILYWNFRVVKFNATTDIIIPANCSIVAVEENLNNMYVAFLVQSPVLNPGQTFNMTVLINSSSMTAHRDLNRSTLVESVALGLYPPMFRTTLVTDDRPVSSSSTGVDAFSSSTSLSSSSSQSNQKGSSSAVDSSSPSFASSSAFSSSRVAANPGSSSSSSSSNIQTASSSATSSVSSTSQRSSSAASLSSTNNNNTISTSSVASSSASSQRMSSSSSRFMTSSSVSHQASSSSSFPVSDIPVGTVKITFSVEISDGSSMSITLITALRNDIASTIAQLYGLAADLIRPFIQLSIETPISSLRRRLLSSSAPVSFVLLGNVTSVTGNVANPNQPAVSAMSIASSVGNAISNGNLNRTESQTAGVFVPVQPTPALQMVAVIDTSSSGTVDNQIDEESSSSSSSSSSLSAGAIAGIVIGSTAGVILLVAVVWGILHVGSGTSASVAVKPPLQVNSK